MLQNIFIKAKDKENMEKYKGLFIYYDVIYANHLSVLELGVGVGLGVEVT